MSDAAVRRPEEAIDNPSSVGRPTWMRNRRKDPMTGKDLHLLSSDLDLRVKDDIDLMRETRSWKRDPCARGLKVRGQHTKTTGRTGRSVGVSKKQQQQQQQPR